MKKLKMITFEKKRRTKINFNLREKLLVKKHIKNNYGKIYQNRTIWNHSKSSYFLFLVIFLITKLKIY